jgi:lysophospholipase L1-like esterase
MFGRFGSRVGLVGVLVALVGLPTATIGTSGTAGADTPTYYVAMGDSFALGVGAEPPSSSQVNQVYERELAHYPGLVLMNYSCGNVINNGESAQTMLNGPYGCTGANDARGDGPKPASQLAAVEEFLKAHVGQIAFLTIDIGGHDVTTPGKYETALKHDLNAILSRLAAADPGIRIFGANYYTPGLADWLGGPDGQASARSGAAFATPFNALLDTIYGAAGYPHADIAAAFDNENFALTGTYNGTTLPQNVANVCNFTHLCDTHDVHPNNTGHTVFADAFVRLIDNYPGTPMTPTAKPQDRSAVVSWKAPKPTNGPPLTGYVVTTYLVSGKTLIAQAARTFPSTPTSQTVSSLTNAKTYQFRVAAKNATGVGQSSGAPPTIKIGKVIPPKNACSSLSGSGAFNPALPIASSSATVKPTASLTGTFSGCTGGGVTSGHMTFTSQKTAATNCTLFPTTYGPSSKGIVGTETIKWNTGKSSTVAITIKLLSSAGSSSLTGTVTAGLFKGSHQTGQSASMSPPGSCVSKPLATFVYAPIASSIFK